jgi:hypothetical protein
MTGLPKLHELELHHLAAEHNEHAARRHREAAKLLEAGDVLAAAHQALLVHGRQAHAIWHATEAAKDHVEAHGKK